jgi:1-acyl-sn-glycerol-3-phosphate acyltransferase
VAWTRQKGPGLIWRLTQIVVLPLFRAIITLRIRPESALPQTGPFILAPNHYSEADPVIMGVATWRLGRIPRFLAKASLFRVPVLGPIFGLQDIFPSSGAQMPKLQPLGSNQAVGGKRAGRDHLPRGDTHRRPRLVANVGKNRCCQNGSGGQYPPVPGRSLGNASFMGRYEAKIRSFPDPALRCWLARK